MTLYGPKHVDVHSCINTLRSNSHVVYLFCLFVWIIFYTFVDTKKPQKALFYNFKVQILTIITDGIFFLSTTPKLFHKWNIWGTLQNIQNSSNSECYRNHKNARKWINSKPKLPFYRDNNGSNSSTSVCVFSRRLRDFINNNDILSIRAGPESRYPGTSASWDRYCAGETWREYHIRICLRDGILGESCGR